MIDTSTVQNVAKLARLEFTSDELERLTHELNSVLEYIDQLTEVDVANVEPLESLNEGLDAVQYRSDAVLPSLSVEQALSNAPKSADNFFLVPKVLQQGTSASKIESSQAEFVLTDDEDEPDY